MEPKYTVRILKKRDDLAEVRMEARDESWKFLDRQEEEDRRVRVAEEEGTRREGKGRKERRKSIRNEISKKEEGKKLWIFPVGEYSVLLPTQVLREILAWLEVNAT